jgi:hypothetical protein
MSPISSIQLSLSSPVDQGRITQLYRYLELFSEDDPPRHSLFVFAPAGGPLPIDDSTPNEEQLLIIDPPADINDRFRVGSQVAALFTGTPTTTSLPLLQTVPGGVAHIRIGNHFLDVYSQRHGAIVHLPALGIICGGEFGSDGTVPRLAAGSDGTDELDALRLLARLVKQHRLSLYIPRSGNEIADKVVVMERLAADVAYLHGLRRIVTPLAQRYESMEAISDLAESVLPRERRTPAAKAAHESNVNSLAQTVR